MTFDASYDMDKAAKRRMENVSSNAATRDFVAAAKAEKRAINRAFALAFEGDEDAAAAKVAEDMGVPVARVENCDAYGEACAGVSRESLITDYVD